MSRVGQEVKRKLRIESNSLMRSSESVGTREIFARRSRSGKKTAVPGFLKSVSIHWNLFKIRFRAFSEEIFLSDDLVDDLFMDVDSEETLDRLARLGKGYTSTEEHFLKEYLKHQSLDKMHESYLQSQSLQEDTKSSATALSETQAQTSVMAKAWQPVENGEAEAAAAASADATAAAAAAAESEQQQEDEVWDVEKIGEIPEIAQMSFQELDVCKIRENLGSQRLRGNNKNTPTKKDGVKVSGVGVGEKLWELRRSKWVAKDHHSKEKLKTRLEQLSISHISKDSYIRIYSYLVDKEKVLKDDKRLNLSDLIKVINEGWMAEEKWERAAKGLP